MFLPSSENTRENLEKAEQTFHCGRAPVAFLALVFALTIRL